MGGVGVGGVVGGCVTGTPGVGAVVVPQTRSAARSAGSWRLEGPGKAAGYEAEGRGGPGAGRLGDRLDVESEPHGGDEVGVARPGVHPLVVVEEQEGDGGGGLRRDGDARDSRTQLHGVGAVGGQVEHDVGRAALHVLRLGGQESRCG